MPLPKAIQAELDRADAHYAQPQPTDQGEGDNQAPTDETPKEQPAAIDDPAVNQFSEAQPAEPEQPKSQGKDDDDEELWKQRYKSFKGQADAELGRMNQRVKEAEQRSSQLEQTLQSFQQKLEALEANKQQEAERQQAQEYQVTPDEIETYGQDLIDVQRKVAHQVLNDARKVWDVERQSLLNRIEELQQSVGNVSQSVGNTVKQQFYSQLAQAMPDWQARNEDPGFLEWLSQPDEFSGVQRQMILNHAADQNDVDRVVRIFQSYKATPGQAESPAPTRQKELERQVSPSRARGSGASPQADQRGKKVWSQAEIGNFYDGLARGRYSQEDATKIESEINHAVAEGRVAM